MKDQLTKEEYASGLRQTTQAIREGILKERHPFRLRTADDFDRPGDQPLNSRMGEIQMDDLVARLRANAAVGTSRSRIGMAKDMRLAADEIERLREALEPFARYGLAHYQPGVGMGSTTDLGPEHVWLCHGPGYPQLRIRHFTKAAEVRGDEPLPPAPRPPYRPVA